MKNIGLIVHPARDEAKDVAEQIVEEAGSLGMTAEAGVTAQTDFVVSVGGDGTMLAAAAQALEFDKPIIGVNVGHVGYLAEIPRDGVASAMRRIANGEFRISLRSTLVATLENGDRHTSLNDFVIEKEVSQRVIHIEVAIDGNPFARYRADGLILATATGSTAYSLSAGGPVVDPELDVVLLTPVAAHSAFTRPLVLSRDAIVTVTVTSERRARLNSDGIEVAMLDLGGHVNIGGGDQALRLITFDSRPYPHAVFEEFGHESA